MTNLNELNLRNIESNEIRLRIVPTASALECSCLQDLMRDYSDISDWMTEYYAEHGREARGRESYAYAVKLTNALEAAIRKALDLDDTMRAIGRCRRIADEADKLIRERYGSAYEILYDGENDGYVVAAPAYAVERGDPHQPTAIYIDDAEEFADAKELYRAALGCTELVDKLIK